MAKILATKIADRAMRYIFKYKRAKNTDQKVDITAALTILSIAQHMNTADANKLINVAETIVR
jgi:hypothetical protein